MTQQDKQLLLKDLCARLPYGVIVRVHDIEHGDFDSYVDNISNSCIETNPVEELTTDFNPYVFYKLQEIKPYLRPMSSMTQEEFEKLKEYSGLKYEQLDLASFQNGTYKCLDFYLSEIPSDVVILVFDWLNEHHFDYRGLIEMGLALEAPEGIYN